MLRPRIIPCLLVRNGGLVKTVRFGEPKYVGDPINAVQDLQREGGRRADRPRHRRDREGASRTSS